MIGEYFMASFEEHCNDCERLLGDRCEEVNRWLDACFNDFGPLHRFARHHWRGVDEAAKLFSIDASSYSLASKAAAIHILKDCGFVPKARDWAEQRVDSLGILPDSGFKGSWNSLEFDKSARKLLRNMEPCD